MEEWREAQCDAHRSGLYARYARLRPNHAHIYSVLLHKFWLVGQISVGITMRNTTSILEIWNKS